MMGSVIALVAVLTVLLTGLSTGLVNSGSNITLGDGVFINRRVMLDDRGPLTIGDHSMLAAGVTVETHAHVFDDFTRPMPRGGRLMKPVAIGPECLIGYNAVVMAGTTVGTRAIVAANSVVTKDVADYHVVGGVPAKPIKVIAPEARPGGDGVPATGIVPAADVFAAACEREDLAAKVVDAGLTEIPPGTVTVLARRAPARP